MENFKEKNKMETNEKIVKPIQEEKENMNLSPEDTHEANTSFGQGGIIFFKND